MKDKAMGIKKDLFMYTLWIGLFLCVVLKSQFLGRHLSAVLQVAVE